MTEIAYRHPAFGKRRDQCRCGACFQRAERDGEPFCLEHLVKLHSPNFRGHCFRCEKCRVNGKPVATVEKVALAHEEHIGTMARLTAAVSCRWCPSVAIVYEEEKVPPFRQRKTTRRRCGWYGDELVRHSKAGNLARCPECIVEGRKNLDGEPYEAPLVGVCSKYRK